MRCDPPMANPDQRSPMLVNKNSKLVQKSAAPPSSVDRMVPAEIRRSPKQAYVRTGLASPADHRPPVVGLRPRLPVHRGQLRNPLDYGSVFLADRATIKGHSAR